MHKSQNRKHQQEQQGDHGMPKGKGTYGSKVGRPPKRKKMNKKKKKK
jgi:hypothetical protein